MSNARDNEILSLAAKAAIRKYLLLIFAPSGILVAIVSFLFGSLVKESTMESAKAAALKEVVKDVSDVRIALHDASRIAKESEEAVSKLSAETADALKLVRQTSESATRLQTEVGTSQTDFRRLKDEFGDVEGQRQLLHILRETKEISKLIEAGVDSAVKHGIRVTDSGVARVKVDSFGRGIGIVPVSHLSDASQILATPVGHYTFEVLANAEKPVYSVTIRGLSFPSTDPSTPTQFVVHVLRLSGAQVDEDVAIHWAVTEKPAPPSL